MRSLFESSAIALASIALSTPALAQNREADSDVAAQSAGDEMIVVTATRRETNLQDTPLSISAISGRQLEEQGIVSVADAIGSVPGVSIINSTPGRNEVTIRGVNTANSTETVLGAIVNSTTATYLNQVPVTSTIQKTPDFRFVDIDRVEVLRGPQGTLYGQSSMGGVVRYITNRPDTNDFSGSVSGYVSSTRGGGENYGIEGHVNLPIIKDRLAIRLVGYHYQNSGFIDIVGTNLVPVALTTSPGFGFPAVPTGESALGNVVSTRTIRDANDEKTSGARAALRFDVTDNITFDVTYLYNNIELDAAQTIGTLYTPGTGGFDLGYTSTSQIPGFQAPSTDRLEFMHQNPSSETSHIVTAEIKASFDPVEVNIIAGHKDTKNSALFEGGDFAGGHISSFTNAITNARSNIDTLEARVSSNWENKFFDWSVGYYYENANGAIDNFSFTSNAPFTFFTTIGLIGIDASRALTYRENAFYGEVSFNFTDRLTLTGGYRHSNVKNNYQFVKADGFLDPFFGRNPAIVQKADESVDLYKANLSYKPTDDLLFYAQAASGYRPGGFNPGNPLAVPAPILDSEFSSDTLWNYEFGMRSSWLDDALVFNAAGYYIDWSDIQLPVRGPAPNFFSSTQNAGKAEIYGLELEMVIRPAPNFTVSANYAYTDAKLVEITPSPVVVPNPALIGNQLPGTPKHSFNISANWTKPLTDSLNFNLNSSLRSVSKSPGALGAVGTDSPAYEQVDVRAGLSFDNGLNVTAFVDNLFDVIPVYRRIGGALIGYEVWTVGRPRTVGVRAGFKF